MRRGRSVTTYARDVEDVEDVAPVCVVEAVRHEGRRAHESLVDQADDVGSRLSPVGEVALDHSVATDADIDCHPRRRGAKIDNGSGIGERMLTVATS